MTQKKIAVLKAVGKKQNTHCVPTIDAPAFTPPYLTRDISSSYLLFVSFMTAMKTMFPVWNDFQFYLTNRQANILKQLLYCTQDEIPYNLPNSEPKYC